jgi:hypothetical protein
MQQLQATPHPVLFEPPALPAVTVITASEDNVAATAAAPIEAIGSATLVLVVTEAQVAGSGEVPGTQLSGATSPLDSFDETSKASLLFAIQSHSFEGKQVGGWLQYNKGCPVTPVNPDP